MKNILENWSGIIIIALITIVLMVTKIFVTGLSWWIIMSPILVWLAIIVIAPFIIMWIVKQEIKDKE